jgi:hypothetical protein
VPATAPANLAVPLTLIALGAHYYRSCRMGDCAASEGRIL